MSSTKCQWGVQIGKPTKHLLARNPDSLTLDNQGEWCKGGLTRGKTDYSKPLLFATRREARDSAREYSAFNKFWRFHARKYIP